MLHNFDDVYFTKDNVASLSGRISENYSDLDKWYGEAFPTYEGGTRGADNGGTGAQNILDLSGPIAGEAHGLMVVTPAGPQYLPSLNAVAAERPMILSAVQAPWEVVEIFGQNAEGTHSDPTVIHNTETDGYFAAINQATSWIDDRGQVCAEFIVDWAKTIDTTDDNPFQIGCYGWQEAYFNGLIDEVRLYNRALSAGEALGLSGQTTPRHKAF